MQAERGRPGQYVGKVDAGSAAEAAGLKDGDRIVEVNGSNIDHDTHKQVGPPYNFRALTVEFCLIARSVSFRGNREIFISGLLRCEIKQK